MHRSSVLTTFGCLNIVFAVAGMLGVVGAMLAFAVLDAETDPVLQALQDNVGYRGWLDFGAVPVLVASVVLLIAGFGLLQQKRWARVLSLAWGAGALFAVLVNLGVFFQLVLFPFFARLGQLHGVQSGDETDGVGGLFGFVLVFSMFGAVYPLVVLVVMNSRKTRAAFDPPPEPPPLPAGT